MKFYKLGDVAIQGDDQVFKASPVSRCITFIVLSGLAIGALYLAIHGGKSHGLNMPAPIFYILAVILGLCAWYAFSTFRASLKPSNWLLRCNRTGVIIKYRSFLNWRFPGDDIQAVGLDYSEIAWARTVREKRTTPDIGKNGASQTTHLTYLDFCLANADTAALEAQLQVEQNLSPDGMVTTCDYPVSVSPGGMIEIRWSGGISPSVGKAIQYLSQHAKVVAAESRAVDLVHRRNLSPEAERGKIVELLKSGDEMGALKLTQQIYGYSLTEAKNFVDQLQAAPEK